MLSPCAAPAIRSRLATCAVTTMRPGIHARQLPARNLPLRASTVCVLGLVSYVRTAGTRPGCSSLALFPHASFPAKSNKRTTNPSSSEAASFRRLFLLMAFNWRALQSYTVFHVPPLERLARSLPQAGHAPPATFNTSAQRAYTTPCPTSPNCSEKNS